MLRQLLGIAVFCGVATSLPAADGRPVNLVTYFLAPRENDQEGLVQLATQYDAVILHEWSADKLPLLRSINPEIICLLYKSGMGLHLRNDVESVDLYANHATVPEHDSWFQTDSSGNRIFWDHNSDGILDNVAMRPENPDWQRFWYERALEDVIAQGWDGVLADDLWCYLGVYGTPAGYPSNAALQDAVTQFLEAQARAFHSRGLYFCGNIGWWTVDDHPVYLDYMAHMDAGMQEKFSPDSQYQWFFQMQELQTAISNGHYTALIRYGEHSDTRRALYSFCNALLVTDGRHVYYGYLNPQDPSSRPPYYPWYDRSTRLGRPTGDYVIDYRNRTASRAFTGGLVYVNPGSTTRTVTLPAGTWYNRDGQVVTALTLGAFSGDFVCNRP